MEIGFKITLIGISLVLMYIVIQILTFYGIDTSSYGKYIAFYVFLLLSTFVLPNNYPTLNNSTQPIPKLPSTLQTAMQTAMQTATQTAIPIPSAPIAPQLLTKI